VIAKNSSPNASPVQLSVVITNYQLPITYYQLPITYHPLPITYHPLPN
ncbi:MAG: threonylcarbamoyl-AMP synthase, partial [Dolichospermum sp.]|nr:threonylcarbamoyl-AMP synthase [Dolichospermum sp.]